MAQKKILVIQDMSCTGRCSITVALPLLSACGFETAVVPTSVLSTHTGGFVDYYHIDLTDDMDGILEHWKKLNMHFDGIYVGFLASKSQVDNTIRFIEQVKDEATIIFVDPAMADEGELYSLLPEGFPKEMKRLCAMSNVMVPNMSEAFMLLDMEYEEGPYEERKIEEMLKKLAKINETQVILTGVSFEDNRIGAASYHTCGDFHFYACRYVDGMFYGAGDVFMSVLVGAIMNDLTIPRSIDISCEFVLDCIERTVMEAEDYRYGLNFEQGIPFLLRLLNKI